MKLNLLRFCVLGAMAFSVALAARADTLYDNLTATSSGTDPIASPFGPLADSFATGSSAFTLNTVVLDLVDDSPSDGGSITVTLYSDSSTSPGVPLDTIGTILDSSLNSSLSDVTLTPDIELSADTTYWIELTGIGGSSADWSYSLDTSGTGVAGQYIYYNDGVHSDGVDGAFQMELEGVEGATAATPEPSSLLLLGSGLSILAASLRRRRFAGRA